MYIENNKNLKENNTFGIDANALFFFSYHTESEIQEFLQTRANWLNRYPTIVIGQGSNILFTKDFKGLVIQSLNTEIELLPEDENYYYIKAGAGTNWDDFVAFCCDKNMGGVENLSYIPGSVGASPVQNIGAYGTEAKDVIHKVRLIDIESATFSELTNKECKFGYRNSIFKNEYKGRFVVTSVVYRLPKNHDIDVSYKGIEEELSQTAQKPYSIADVRKAIINIRRFKLPDHKILGNAGSFFKNPVIRQNDYSKLQKSNPDIPGYRVGEEQVKVPAAYLIEKCGWKGKNYKSAGVYQKQPLVLVNHGFSTGQEIVELANNIKQNVFEKFQIKLEPEVLFV